MISVWLQIRVYNIKKDWARVSWSVGSDYLLGQPDSDSLNLIVNNFNTMKYTLLLEKPTVCL